MTTRLFVGMVLAAALGALAMITLIKVLGG